MRNVARGKGWPRAVVFDLDGTLVDSAPDIAASLNEVLGWRDLAPFPLADVRRMIGGGIRLLITRALEAHGVATDDVQPVVDDMLRVYAGRATELTVLFEGAEDTLRDLRGAGVKLAVCTNKVQHITDIILRDLDIAQYFASVVGARPDLPRKPDPAMLHCALAMMEIGAAEAVMVGDSSADSGAAQAAGMPVILAEFGYAPGGIAALAPDAIFAHFADLPAVLASLRTL